ncbi:MAG: ATP-dependent DNA helicase RecG [Alphaproteobacteria bacterium]
MRPEILFPLFKEVKNLKGIGPRYAALIEKLCGPKALDLVWHLPTHFLYRNLRDEIDALRDGEIATLELTTHAHQAPPPGKRNVPYRVICNDGMKSIDLIYFHARGDYLQNLLPVGEKRLVSGQIEWRNGNWQMTHPDYVVTHDQVDTIPAIEPVYPLTAGLPAKVMRKSVATSLKLAPTLPEWLDQQQISNEHWMPWLDALQIVHLGHEDGLMSKRARNRLAFDELLANQLGLIIARENMKKQAGFEYDAKTDFIEKLIKSLPFEPTVDQKQAFDEISNDLQSNFRMSRLLQGDVGSGKTLVALLAMTVAVGNGKQAALMAPTDLLARQHLLSLKALAEPIGLNIQLLTGKIPAAQARAVREQLAAGEIDIIVGTHALYQESVSYKDLGLIIIDEQHRFGVEQRQTLQLKGKQTELLSMTATPIPRTLAMTQYGDMDVSRILNKPAGRKEITTGKAALESLESVLTRLKNALDKDPELQVYWVCPLVEESEKLDLIAAEYRRADLESYFGEGATALVHGQMPQVDKEAAMERFVENKARILVATTVIEVGVDVPNASIMVIEQAERFGLAQMHQLRGRVGRGSKASSCLLMYKSPLSKTAAAKIGILLETNDGFKIAEEDLRLRGIGEVLGTKQTGVPNFKIADLENDTSLMENARRYAELLMNRASQQPVNLPDAVKTLLYLFEKDQALKFRRA